MPFFSIIIPVYNVAPYLRECLDSVLAQTFTDWEAICVDDGSTDGSGTILDEYAAKDKRFKVIHQANAGVSVARNVALDVAQGEWIGFMDADDKWSEHWLTNIASAIGSDTDWIRAGCTNWVDGSNAILDEDDPKNHQCKKVIGDDVVNYGWKLISRCAVPFENFYRRNVVADVRFCRDVRFREDALFLFAVALRVCSVRIIGERGYFRRIRAGSATYSPRHRGDTIRLMCAYVGLWEHALLSGKARLLKNAEVVAASTYWVSKDVHEWFALCPDRTVGDAFMVWRMMIRLIRLGAISPRCEGSFFENLRWRLYLATGVGRILFVNRLNIFGTIRSIKNQ